MHLFPFNIIMTSVSNKNLIQNDFGSRSVERADIKRGAGTSLWLSRTAEEKSRNLMWNEQQHLFDASSSLHQQSGVKEWGGVGRGEGRVYKLTLPNVPNSAARLMTREGCRKLIVTARQVRSRLTELEKKKMIFRDSVRIQIYFNSLAWKYHSGLKWALIPKGRFHFILKSSIWPLAGVIKRQPS